MVGREVCVGVGMAVGPGDPEGLIVVDADSTVFSDTRQCQCFVCLGDTGN
jgi:hypothetical protein